MPEENIFGNKPTVEDGSSTPSSVEALGTLLAGITNEKGEQKYSDIPKALEALASSQTYIPELHTKMDAKDATIAELREKLVQQEAVDDVLQRLQATHQGQEEHQPKGLDAGEAAKLFEDLLGKNEQRVARSKNTAAVTETLGTRFGDKAEEVFYAKGKELGLTPQALNDLAGTSPAAVLALFGETSKGTTTDVSQGGKLMPTGTQDERKEMGRNTGKSVLSGSTSRDVRAEYDIVVDLVKDLHEKGISVDDLTDPKIFRQTFG